MHIWHNLPMTPGSADDVLCFVAIVRTGSMAAAARKLGLGPSTLSRRLSELEARLGVRLLERTTRTLKLTEIGEAFFTRCAPLADGFAEAELLAESLGKTPRGLLRIAAPPMWGALCLGGPLAEYSARYPAVRVQVDLSDRPVELRREGYDIAIRLGLPAGDTSYRVRRLGGSPRLLCASPGFLRKNGAPRSLAELREYPLIGLGGATANVPWTFVDDRQRPLQVTVTPRLYVNNALLAQDLVRRDAGIALLPRFLVRDDLQAARLTELSLDGAPAPSEVLLLTLASSSRVPKVRAFVDILQALAVPPAPWH